MSSLTSSLPAHRLRSAAIEQIFGRSRQRIGTGSHVEVVREAAAVGERRRYTKQFFSTKAGDLRAWTGRESRILADLARRGVRCVPALAADAGNGPMQTLDAGASVEQLVTLLPLERDGRVVLHVFADCAHWWALARHMLRVLDTLHVAEIVHLDVNPHHVCIPVLPADFTPNGSGATITLKFARLALIDFAFSLAPSEPLASPLPIGPTEGYRCQSPRLLEALAAGRKGDLGPTSSLDWRCDMYSLAAMLRLYLPAGETDGWTVKRHGQALALLAALDDAHDRDVAPAWPHQLLIDMCDGAMEDDLVASLVRGFAMAPADAPLAASPPSTPLTRIVSAIAVDATAAAAAVVPREAMPLRPQARKRPLHATTLGALTAIALVLAAGLALYSADRQQDVVASSGDSQPAPSSRPASAPAAAERLAGAPPAADGSEPDARHAPNRGTLPVDAATAQRAADAAAQDKPKTQAQVARPIKPPRVSEPSPTAVAEAAEPPHSPPSAAPSRLPPPAAASRSPPPDAAPESPLRPEAKVAASGDVAVNTPGAENDRQKAQPEAPAARSPAEASLTGQRTIARIPHPASDDVVTRAERDVARVLASAAKAAPGDDEGVRQAARSMPPEAAAPRIMTESAPLARHLNDRARAAWERNDIRTALSVQQAAFRANPNDTEVSGNLAFYHLKARPVQPELARRLAIHALAARGQDFPGGRFQDWGTLAVASALTGREADARAAMVVMLDVSGNPERACRAARLAVAQYGEALKAPTEAMLARVQARGVRGAPSCN